MFAEVSEARFWMDLLRITGIDILLSGDNAVVIALASRSLPAHQRKWAVFGGCAGAILLRVLFCLVIVWLMGIPYLKLIGGLLLLYIGIKLMLPESSDGHGEIAAKSNLWGAIQTILIADAVMSLDNVVAIAAIAKESVLLIVLGLLISIPLIIFGSQLVLRFLLRFPLLVTAGAGLLGWIAGEIIAGEEAVQRWLSMDHDTLALVAKPGLALVVMGVGSLLARRMSHREKALVDLAPGERQ